MPFKEYVREKYRRFFDKTRGDEVELTEFPFLFAMLNYSGWSGVILTVGWFAILVAGLVGKFGPKFFDPVVVNEMKNGLHPVWLTPA